ncbi:hypothetical protein ACJMK2_024284 [Sinanodonta woodiana]|uniref:Zinc finger MYND domain-containing protein 11 n=1 Tax=Sinanodonta woodiana TaxID=1069815 RepID=A0ABD3T7T3_SINWO
MVQATKRRQANVQRVQQLQTAISYIRQQKQISNLERLIKYMHREHGIGKADTERQLQHAVKDSLILSYTGIGFKGSKTGVEYEGFRVPELEEIEFEDDGHDWYCFDCHCPGEVVCCSDCWRVYHRNCTPEDTTEATFTCTVCKAGRKKNKTKRKFLNTLLSYTVMRLKEKTRELHRIGHREEEKKYMPFFVYKPMDLNKMEQKVTQKQYRTVEEFLSDSKLIFHNVFLIYGDDTKDGMAELARIMIRDCKYDLDEMLQCQNCYYMSNAKPKDWFCQPCEISHELVYAKLKGYSYWPAKVIRYLEDNKYDVRFFGSLHQRALIPKEQIKPINIGMKDLNAKRTTGFVKACEELKLHQKLLEEQLLKPGKKKTEGEDNDEESEEEEEEEMENIGDKAEDKEEDEKSHDAVSSTSQSAKNSNQKVSSPEDSNIVTSSEEYIPLEKKTKMQIVTATIGVQTSKKTSNSASKIAITQTDADTSNKTCDCDTKYNKIFNDFKERLENDHRDGKDKALKELAERLQRDFEEDKQQAVSRAMGKLQQELEKVRRQTEEKCKEQYMEEMKKLAQKHKEAISGTKKKQWCYNCEEEAMYHCCWNTSYCSVKCQQEHWHKEHKRVCRRKR